MRKRICIISFSPIHRDARVLRQIEYLSPHYDLTVIGYGPAHSEWPGVEWLPVETRSNALTKVMGVLLLVLGRLYPEAYKLWYWQKPHHKRALHYALTSKADAFHANDWNALPVAAEAARQNRARLVLDAHEYAPLELENRWYWRPLYTPLIINTLRKYAPRLDGSMTVAEPIAVRYKNEFGFDPLVVLNAPKLVPLPPRKQDPKRIRLIHHGAAMRDRHLDLTVKALSIMDSRFHLHFFLVGPDDYMQELKQLSARLAPGRVTFHEPVPPEEIVDRIAEYDIGFFLLKPNSYNYRMAMPNKFFDFLAAGLAVCVGPSPGMAALVKEHGFGCVTPSFRPEDAAKTLNALTSEQIEEMQRAAREAAALFNADKEMDKVVQLYGRLFNEVRLG